MGHANTSPAFPFPRHLAGTEAAGAVPGEPVGQFELGDHRNFVYLITDWRSKEAAIVDPQSELAPVRQALREHGLALRSILLTHTHFDHIAGVPALLREDPTLHLRVHEKDARRLDPKIREATNFHALSGGEMIQVGQLQLQVIHTPGHSSGEVCFFMRHPQPGFLFTGDTLFIRDCGRTDLESGSNSEMFASLQLLKGLPPETVILPGHHYSRECASTLGRELEQSPPLRTRSVEELANLP